MTNPKVVNEWSGDMKPGQGLHRGTRTGDNRYPSLTSGEPHFGLDQQDLFVKNMYPGIVADLQIAV
jgi:hypothetical protein